MLAARAAQVCDDPQVVLARLALVAEQSARERVELRAALVALVDSKERHHRPQAHFPLSQARTQEVGHCSRDLNPSRFAAAPK